MIRSQAVLIAIGINWDLGVEVANRQEFLIAQRARTTMQGSRKPAPRSYRAVWQRCVHFLGNTLAPARGTMTA